ncbi:MAG: hypothetical protein AMQ22_00025 [Candidatus Methanofastidiosum methylothiophilum]|uniref:Uncharacterized protein n=1 Tax=Candidatus Methanofastidiosum methylothiophilum TaxID=1705564 RepID=A0A150J9F0_9EURY|nr:MAG: hypothetical protein AMQ22_00025 [Candidatus Methanofastidiosum methylthiophilus]
MVKVSKKLSMICIHFPECGDIRYKDMDECKYCLEEAGFFDYDQDLERELLDMEYDLIPHDSEILDTMDMINEC